MDQIFVIYKYFVIVEGGIYISQPASLSAFCFCQSAGSPSVVTGRQIIKDMHINCSAKITTHTTFVTVNKQRVLVHRPGTRYVDLNNAGGCEIHFLCRDPCSLLVFMFLRGKPCERQHHVKRIHFTLLKSERLSLLSSESSVVCSYSTWRHLARLTGRKHLQILPNAHVSIHIFWQQNFLHRKQIWNKDDC